MKKVSIYKEVRDSIFIRYSNLLNIDREYLKKVMTERYSEAKEKTVIRAVNMALAELKRTEKAEKVALEWIWGIFKKKLIIISTVSIFIGFLIGKFF